MSNIRYCVSADALLELVPEAVKSSACRATPTLILDKSKIGYALRWIDPNDTSTWVKVGMALKALEPEIDEAAEVHWLAFSESADEASKVNNDDPRYDPPTMWEGFAPVMSAEAGMAVIMSMARDGAGEAVKEALPCGDLGERGREAVNYLEQRHPRFLNSLLAEAGMGGEV